MKENCKNCKFFKDEGKKCHRYPPLSPDAGDNYTVSKFTEFVYVDYPEDTWCGEYVPVSDGAKP